MDFNRAKSLCTKRISPLNSRSEGLKAVFQFGVGSRLSRLEGLKGRVRVRNIDNVTIANLSCGAAVAKEKNRTCGLMHVFVRCNLGWDESRPLFFFPWLFSQNATHVQLHSGKNPIVLYQEMNLQFELHVLIRWPINRSNRFSDFWRLDRLDRFV